MAITKLAVEEAAYIAGFLDGDGSVSCRPRTPATRGKSYRVVFGQKKPEVLMWIRDRVGAGTVSQSKGQTIFGFPRGYQLTIQGRHQVTDLLNQLIPYMIVRKDEAIRVTFGKHPRQADHEEIEEEPRVVGF